MPEMSSPRAATSVATSTSNLASRKDFSVVCRRQHGTCSVLSQCDTCLLEQLCTAAPSSVAPARLPTPTLTQKQGQLARERSTVAHSLPAASAMCVSGDVWWLTQTPLIP